MDSSDTKSQSPQTSTPYLIHESQIPPGEIKERHLTVTTTIANGDLLYGDGNNNFTRLAPGTVGQLLTMVGGVPAWSPASLAQGDILYYDVNKNLSRLGAGTSGQFLKTQGMGANPLWADATSSTGNVRAKVRTVSNQTLSNATFAAVAFTSEDFDVGAMHDNAVNNSRLTVPTGGAGVYLLMANIAFNNSSGTGERVIDFNVNGGDIINYGNQLSVTNSDIAYLSISTLYNAADADYFTVTAYQNSGGNLDLFGGNSSFQAIKLV